MTLYCYACNKNHAFHPLEAEKIIYCLQGAFADARLEALDHANPDENFVCLRSILGDAYEIDAYSEHVASCCESRRVGLLKASLGETWEEENLLFAIAQMEIAEVDPSTGCQGSGNSQQGSDTAEGTVSISPEDGQLTGEESSLPLSSEEGGL